MRLVSRVLRGGGIALTAFQKCIWRPWRTSSGCKSGVREFSMRRLCCIHVIIIVVIYVLAPAVLSPRSTRKVWTAAHLVECK